MLKSRLLPAVVFCFLISSTGPLAGTDTEDLMEMSLEELMDVEVTSVSKTRKSVLSSPIPAFVVTHKEIRKKGYRHLKDALQGVPGIFFIDLSTSEHGPSELMVRGIYGNTKMAFLLDGHKINAPTGEPFVFLDSIPLGWVKQIEVSYGSSSSLYGADAIAGIVNIVTFDAIDHCTVLYDTSIGSFHMIEHQFYFGHEFDDGLSLSLGGNYYRTDSEDLSKNYPDEFKGFDTDLFDKNLNLHLKADYKDFSFSYLRLQKKRNNAIGFLPSLYDYSGRSYWDRTDQFAVVEYGKQVSDQFFSKTMLSFGETKLDRDSTYSADYTGSQNFLPHYFYWRGRSGKLEQELTYENDSLKWISGLSYEYFDSIPKTDINHPLGSFHVDYGNLGIFTQAEWSPIESIELTAGVRFDKDSRFSGQVNPRAAALWRALDNLNFKAAWGSSYLAPSPHKMYEVWGDVVDGGYMGLPNEDLKPEKVQNLDLGLEIFPYEDLFVGLGGFFIRASDLWRISYQGQKRVLGKLVDYQINDNIAESRIRGFYSNVRWEPTDCLDFDLNYTATDGRQDAANPANGSVDLTHMPEHLFNGDVVLSKYDWSLALGANWFDAVRTHESNTKYNGDRVSGAWTVDLHLSHSHQIKDLDTTVGLAVNNLFDKKYYKTSFLDEFPFILPETPQPTRTILLYLKIAF